MQPSLYSQPRRYNRNMNIVRDGYDRNGTRYQELRESFPTEPHLDAFIARVTPGRTVLDAGCGPGLPVDRYLLDRGLAVNGIDVSPTMIELAQQNVPDALYEVRDMTTLQRDDY